MGAGRPAGRSGAGFGRVRYHVAADGVAAAVPSAPCAPTAPSPPFDPPAAGARAASALNHPNIVAVYDIVEYGNALAIVLELVPGRSLAEVISTEPPDAFRVLHYATQIASALAAAHREHIVHRDLKVCFSFIFSPLSFSLL